jgi:feruloyl esterase
MTPGRLITAALAAVALPVALYAAPAAGGRHAVHAATDCAAAMRITLPSVHIAAATEVVPTDSLRALGRKRHCRVEAIVDADTHIVALLPDEWNERFLMGGAGGFAGAPENQYEDAVHDGYATVGTDAGHTAFSLLAAWALHDDGRIAEYGHRAVHRTAEVTKAIILAYYGRPSAHSYFIGCSNGGREALIEAQRYPADFDGIVAIAPWIDPLAFSAAAIRSLQAQYPTGDFTAPVVTPTVLRLVASTVTRTCDALDGVKDGTLENPEACAFTLSALPSCANDVVADSCVTRAQRAALHAFTTPLLAGGVRYPGWPFGDEADPAGWQAWITGPVAPILQASAGTAPTVQSIVATQFFKYFVYGDSTWSYVRYDLARAGRDGARVGAVVAATNSNLSAFHARGGKLLLAHGWSDPALSARATIAYFNAVQRRTPQARSFTRLFLMPGVLHCGGGSGCDDVDYPGIIRRWVEQGDAPSRIVARKLDGTKVLRTHPLCAYPMVARYDGTGSTADAASFTCR